MTGCCGISARRCIEDVFSILTHMQKSDAVNNFRSIRGRNQDMYRDDGCVWSAAISVEDFVCLWKRDRDRESKENVKHTLRHYYYIFRMHRNDHLWQFVRI